MAEPVSQLHASAQSGFAGAASYDANRPSYPPESVDSLLKHLKIRGVNGARVIDLAAGTGKFTELLAAQPEVFDILAVEPHADMRAELQRKATEKGWKNVKVEEGFADSMGKVPDQWADAVVVAQAFHWFANSVALTEIHRVMVPGTVLGLIWNVDDFNSHVDHQVETGYEQDLKDMVASFEDNAQRFRNMEWPKAFDNQLRSNPVSIQAADPLFSLPLGEQVTKWQVSLTKDKIWSRIRTHSNMANLEGPDLEKAERAWSKALAQVPVDESGEILFHGNTHMYWTTAIPGAPLRNGG